MNYHIVLHREMDLAAQAEQARLGLSPRHAMGQLAKRLGATVHAPPEQLPTNRQDYLLSKLIGSPQNWAFARKLVHQFGPEDTVFCNSAAAGLPLAGLLKDRPNRPKLAIFAHNLDRPRSRVALRVLRAASKVDWFAACSQHQAEFLKQFLKLPDERVSFVWDQTDLNFFSPGPPSPRKRRPIIVSAGLEKRDYRTLAAATEDLPVDVKVTGFSQDAVNLKKAFPKVLPANMSRQFYEWPDLLQLYRDADVVVVSTFPNRYAAGVQGMMEAMACARPVVVTQTEGLGVYLADNGGVVQVKPGDAVAMRQAIEQLLDHPEQADRLGKMAAAIAQERHDSDRHIACLAQGLEKLREVPSLVAIR
ncbi:glycosyltransferase family 4 protein [Leptolyngbya sp. KIOST-1]|uniref:glycosyltransferase family 4 protein n=1 Tax=Leptolyngbya sp. KIOST-1 TaxID=1229172 RepID=UPI000907AACE|nr:glycosyltransferase family 4 protein [Leptolyngbya sp. KIOST-1]